MYKEICGIYTIEYHSATKKNYILPFAATWIDLESIMVSEMSDRESPIPYDFSYLWSIKTKQNRKPKQKFIDAENKLAVLGGGGGG